MLMQCFSFPKINN